MLGVREMSRDDCADWPLSAASLMVGDVDIFAGDVADGECDRSLSLLLFDTSVAEIFAGYIV